jgi:hypothetical protein
MSASPPAAQPAARAVAASNSPVIHTWLVAPGGATPIGAAIQLTCVRNRMSGRTVARLAMAAWNAEGGAAAAAVAVISRARVISSSLTAR